MKVVLINRSDITGGAAVFTYRLMQALRNAGVDATMLVCDKKCSDAHVVDYSQPMLDRFHFLAERLQIFCNNRYSRSNLFKVDTACWGRDISNHPLVREADVIMLNWINQGALSLRSIEKLCLLGKPVIWTMHDMWNCTGVCHHAYDCSRYKQSCGCCPYLSSSSMGDLSHTTWCKKNNLYKLPNLHFVSVSNWLAEKSHESGLLHAKPIYVIPNTMPVETFGYQRMPNAHFDIPDNRAVLAMGAARLDDPVKGFDMLIDVTHFIKENLPHLAHRLHLILFGDIRDASLLQQIAIPHTHVGRVEPDAVNSIMQHADVVLSTSLYESFGGTLIEGQASGCLPVTFGNGGQTDIVDHRRTGYVAQYRSIEDFAHGIEWAVDAGVDRSSLHNEVVARFAPSVVAWRYIDLCNHFIATL